MIKRAEEGYCSGGQETYWVPEVVGEVQVLLKRLVRDELSGNRF